MKSNPFKNKTDEKGAIEKTSSSELEKGQKPFNEQKEANDTEQRSEFDDDFYYLAGANHVYLRMDPEKGYSFDYDVANGDWLKESIKDKLERETGKNFKVKPRPSRNTFRLYGHNKDLVQKLDEYQNNPDKIREASPQNQNAWLNGFLDANATIDAKESNEPAIHLSNESLEKLELVKDLLENKGVEGKIEKDAQNPRLKITGSNNFRNLKQNTKLENQDKMNDLDKLIKEAERFENSEQTDQVFQDLGRALEGIIHEMIEYIRPDGTDYELRDPTNAHGEGINPDFVIQYPDGNVEFIDAKLKSDNVKPKDKDYLGNKEIMEGTILYWDGELKNTENHYGKPLHYECLKDYYKELERDKEKAGSKREKEKKEKILKELKNFEEKFDEENNKKKDPNKKSTDKTKPSSKPVKRRSNGSKKGSSRESEKKETKNKDGKEKAKDQEKNTTQEKQSSKDSPKNED